MKESRLENEKVGKSKVKERKLATEKRKIESGKVDNREGNERKETLERRKWIGMRRKRVSRNEAK